MLWQGIHELQFMFMLKLDLRMINESLIISDEMQQIIDPRTSYH